ncbi:NucA/NucB deoxyribonuclease domain-containing protein [Nonomuraea basaltis]|uniref:NucA/NucB deoxyribonuclease domain-containing protein n=1 Tax=Nonomuraea basaltis TaxID=2495887 RepID=UPI0014873E88|nr:hypothetical protein [Nonomuraea basaltis]
MIGVAVLALVAAAPATSGQAVQPDPESRFYSNDPADSRETPQGEPLPPEEAMERNLLEAARRGAHSYYDTSKVSLDAPSTRSLSADLPMAPSEDDLRKCLTVPAAKSRLGWTYNRMFWCQELGFDVAYEKVNSQTGERTYKGTNQIRYQMVVAGTNTRRAIRVFFRPITGSLRFPDWSAADNPGDLNLALNAECGQTSFYCSVAGPTVRKTWNEWNTSGAWVSWDVTSNEQASDAPRDKIIFHTWRLTFDGTSLDYPMGGKRTWDRPFRCDSATYFNRWARIYDKACVLTNVIPHLQYDISDDRVSEVALHIRQALDTPAITWPKESHPKNIPGKWFNGDPELPEDLPPGLHRVPGDGDIAKDNEQYKNWACERKGPYNEQTGLPPKTPQQEGYECDEYPFHVAEEGAAHPTYDFSVKWVPKTQNGSAGGRLQQRFFFEDRILHVLDEFWVKIND